MPNSILHDIQGPDWPLGFIAVVTPGTPVRITNLVDPSALQAPETPTGAGVAEYTPLVASLTFQGMKPGASHGTANNTGNVYILRFNSATGSGTDNRDDYGTLIHTLIPGETFTIPNAAFRRADSFSPYRYAVDADNAGDGAQITALI